MPHLAANPWRCSGCRVCELVCSFRHFAQLRPAAAFVRVIREADGRDVVLACRHCKKPSCAEACERGAIAKDAASGLVRFSQERCDGCGSCAEACKLRAIRLVGGKAWHCELCGACVRFCPVGVLEVKR
jgi:Fe-S-cluster-containing hydrogenase component 2